MNKRNKNKQEETNEMDKHRAKHITEKKRFMNSLAEKHNAIIIEIDEKQAELIGKETMLNMMFSNEMQKIMVDCGNLQMIAFFNIQKMKFEKEVKELKSSLVTLIDRKDQLRFEYNISADQLLVL
jgi:hypothetical protein